MVRKSTLSAAEGDASRTRKSTVFQKKQCRSFYPGQCCLNAIHSVLLRPLSGVHAILHTLGNDCSSRYI